MKKYFIILGAALVGLAACNKQETASVSADFDEIAFVTRTAETRGTGVAEATTANLTQFNVIATSGAATQTKVWDDGVFTGSQGGNYTGGKYWPAESVSWNFFASNAPMTFAASGTTIAVANCDSDIVAEYLEGATYKAANALTFEHILCQLGTVQMKAPEGYTVTDLKVSLQPIYAGTYDMKADTWQRGIASAAVYVVGAASAGIAITAADNSYTSADNDLWLLPGQYQLTASYTIAKGDWSNSYEKHASVVLVQGQNNNLILPDADGDGNNNDPNIPDPKDDVTDIIFTVEVTPWGNNDVPATFN